MSEIPLFDSYAALKGALIEYFTKDNFEIVEELLCDGSPWSVLLLFLTTGTTGNVFKCSTVLKGCDYEIPHSKIKFYLESCMKAMQDGNFDLYPYMSSPYETEFSWGGKSTFDEGQLKLGFSLALFCAEVIKKGHIYAMEAGSGIGFGGENHSFVGDLLAASGKVFHLQMLDVMATEGIFKRGSLHCETKRIPLTAVSSYDCPVFFDIFDNHSWMRFQHTPSINMLKKLVVSEGDEYVVPQPYHKECRLFKCGFFLKYLRSSLMVSTNFDNCRECCFWKSLSYLYDIDDLQLYSILLKYGYRPCVTCRMSTFVQKMYDPRREQTNLEVDVRTEVKTRTCRKRVQVPSKSVVRMSLSSLDMEHVKLLDEYIQDCRTVFVDMKRVSYTSTRTNLIGASYRDPIVLTDYERYVVAEPSTNLAMLHPVIGVNQVAVELYKETDVENPEFGCYSTAARITKEYLGHKGYVMSYVLENKDIMYGIFDRIGEDVLESDYCSGRGECVVFSEFLVLISNKTVIHRFDKIGKMDLRDDPVLEKLLSEILHLRNIDVENLFLRDVAKVKRRRRSFRN